MKYTPAEGLWTLVLVVITGAAMVSLFAMGCSQKEPPRAGFEEMEPTSTPTPTPTETPTPTPTDEDADGDLEEEWENLPANGQRSLGQSEADFNNPAADSDGGLLRIFFDYDQHDLDREDRQRLARNADWLVANQDVSVIVEGHCDERGTNGYNLALGQRRAAAVKEYLIFLGISERRLSTISYGEERPIDPRETEQAWARNRRAQFVQIKD